MTDKDKIVDLKTVSPAAEIDRSVIETLEKALDGARKGEFCGVAVAAVKRDRSAWLNTSYGSDQVAMIGAAYCLLQRCYEDSRIEDVNDDEN